MKKVIFTYLIVSILGVSSITAERHSVDGISNIDHQYSYLEVNDMNILCADLLDCSFTNSAVFVDFGTVPAEFTIFTSFFNRSKKLRLSNIKRTCTGFMTALKV